MGLHRIARLPAYSYLVESRGQGIEVTSRHGLDVGIQHNSTGTLEFAPFVGQFMRCGDIDTGPFFSYNLNGSLLMHRVGIRVQEADSNGFGSLAARFGYRCTHLVLDQRD